MNQDKNLAIAFLVHDEVDSAHTALSTLNAFFKYTNIPDGTDVYVVINGHNTDVEDVIELFIKAYEPKVNFIIHQFEENLGCSSGVNHLANLTKEYEYTFFLERDWILLDSTRRDWLTNAIDALEHTQSDIIYFRRLISSLEARQYYGKAPFILKNKFLFGGVLYRETSMHIYTNNPHLRRNSSFFNAGVLPLPEVLFETKHSHQWGAAEIAHENLPEGFKTLYQEYGCFVHYHPSYFENVSEFGHAPAMHPLNQYPIKCEKCRFGFIYEHEPDWCMLCKEKNTSRFTDIEEDYVKLKS